MTPINITNRLPETTKQAPEEIQWMPPGTHTITATQDGKTKTITITVNEATAAIAQAALRDALARNARGEGPRPFFDFDHQNGEASAFPLEFSWGGEDPKTGGVRVRVEWSRAGADVVTGKSYTSFSPAFLLSTDGRLRGFPVNAGGLVNIPAFTRIAPLLAKSSSHESNVILAKVVSEEPRTAADVWNDAFARREAAAAQAIQGKTAAEVFNASLLAREAREASPVAGMTPAEIYEKALKVARARTA